MSLVPAVVTVVVASGSFAQVERWTELLRQIGIFYQVRWSCDENRPTRVNHAELWVDRFSVDHARSAIRGAGDADPALLW